MRNQTGAPQPDTATLGVTQSHTRDNSSLTTPQMVEACSSLRAGNLFNLVPMPCRAPIPAPWLPCLGLSYPKMEIMRTPESTGRPWLVVSSYKVEKGKDFLLPGSLRKTPGRGSWAWHLGGAPPASVASPCRDGAGGRAAMWKRG